MAREPARRRGKGRDAAAVPFWSAPRKALLVVALVCTAFAEDRHVGRVGDGRQMIQTAVAIATTGEVGVARGVQTAATPRPGGDAVARYGLGMALVQVPAAALAPSFERAFGPGGSQSLFLVAPILLGLLSAAAAGRAAGLLGAGQRGQAIAVLLASLGSPLGAYFASDLSEPLQAACLAWAFVASLEARRVPGRRRALLWAALAGAAGAAAVLTKSGLAVVAPLALLPLLGVPFAGPGAPRGARIAAAALGAAPLLAAWLAGELVRFGGLFRGYGGEGFSYPFLEGLVRLLVGPNKGLLLFFPSLALAAAEAVRRARAPGDAASGERAATRLEVLGGGLPLVALLAVAAPWWAWHGVAGWGPRLLVPGLPAVAAFAACALERWTAPRGRLFVAASIGLNALPFLQNPASVAVYTTKLDQVAVEPRVARRFPGYAPPAAPGGKSFVPGAFVLPEVPLAADHVAHAWFLRVRSAGDGRERATRLEHPPWLASRPELRPAALPLDPRFVATVAPPLGFGFLGRSLFGGQDPASVEAYAQALSNQVFRAQQQRKLDRALDLSTRLFRISPRGEAAALVAESYRLLGRHETLRAFLDSLPREVRGAPPVFVVIALAARDVGEDAAAKAYLERAADLGTPALAAALAGPPAAWPADFAAFVTDERLSTAAVLPGLGDR